MQVLDTREQSGYSRWESETQSCGNGASRPRLRAIPCPTNVFGDGERTEIIRARAKFHWHSFFCSSRQFCQVLHLVVDGTRKNPSEEAVRLESSGRRKRRCNDPNIANDDGIERFIDRAHRLEK